jgi:hypothetical protein
MAEEEPTVIVASFQITKSMPNQSQLVISGHFYNKDDPTSINARLDEWIDRAERQFERAGMALRIAQRKAQVDNLDRIKERYAEMADQVQQGVKLKTQQLAEYKNGQASINAALKVIKQMDLEIAETKKRVGMA